MRDGMPLPATVSPARSGKPFSRLETKKGDFPKSNVGKLNSVKPGIVQKARGGGWVACFAEKEGAYFMLKENLPGGLGGKSNWQEDACFRPQKVQSLP